MAATGSRVREGWIAWRNRRLSDPKFQRWAADFPLTRGIARKRAAGLFDIVAGFIYSQALSACVRLRVLERLAEAPKTAEAVAAACDLPADAAGRLLSAATALGLAQKLDAGRYALGPQGAALLGNPGLSEMIAHHEGVYADIADSVGFLRSGGGKGALAAYWPYATSAAPETSAAEGVADYSALMAATLPAAAADVFKAYPVRRHRRLLDVGGGEGAFLAAAGHEAPNLGLMLFDLPAVTERAKVRLEREGLAARAEVFGGDFLTDPLPQGADLITLIRILHDHDDAGVAAILKAARAALPKDGALLIAEPMAGGARPNRVGDVYFAFYLMAMGRGRARSPETLFAMLRAAGFTRMRLLKTRTPLLLRAILAQP